MPAAAAPANSSLRPALVLIGLVLVVRLIYTIFLCPYDLVEDEAHYWLWSRHLDWSYYSKGPGIAWAIWLSTQVFGHTEWAVRLPTIIANVVGAVACAGLARDIAKSAFVPDGSVATPARAALYAAAAFLLAPAFQLTGILITIDGSYLACWALACWAGWRALMERSRSAWFGLGAAVAIGFLFKYTILLLLPGVVLFALIKRRELRSALAPSRGFAIVIALLLVGLAPVVYWNWREGWPTFRHLLGHLGVAGGDMPVAPSDGGWNYNPLWTLKYIAAPLGMFGPILALAIVAALRILRRRHEPRGSASPGPAASRRQGAIYLLSCAAPILLFYLVVSFIAEPEQNWAVAGFVSLVVLAGWYAADEIARRVAGARDHALTAPGTPRTRPIKVLWRLSLLFGVGAIFFLHFANLTAAGLNRITAIPSVSRAIASVAGKEPRPIVTGRLIGANRMAAHIERLLGDLRESPDAPDGGSRPFVMVEHYGRASQMAYYLNRDVEAGLADPASAETVVCVQSIAGGRRSQFDLWPQSRPDQPKLLGASAVLLANDKPGTRDRYQRLFNDLQPLDTPNHKLDGEHKKDRIAYIGRGYRGLGGLMSGGRQQ